MHLASGAYCRRTCSRKRNRVARILANLRRLPDDPVGHYVLNALHDRNEALFFRVVCDNIDGINPNLHADSRTRLPKTRRYFSTATRVVH